MIIGHKRQLHLLERMIERSAVPHALVFAGPEHVGKRLVAKAFFWKVHNPHSAWKAFWEADDSLARRIHNELHPDMHVVGTDGAIRAQTAREIRSFVGLSPFEANQKFVLVDNAETLGRIGFNTLLKTLEEPAGEVQIILTTSRPDMLPATITSRAATLRFTPVPDKILLQHVPTKKREEVNSELSWIAGRAGLLLRYLDSAKDTAVVRRKEHFLSFRRTLKNSQIGVRLALAERVAKEEMPEVALEAWLLAARAEMLSSSRLDSALLRHIKEAGERLLLTNVNARLALEHALIR